MFEDAVNVYGEVDGALQTEMARKNAVHKWDQLNQESWFTGDDTKFEEHHWEDIDRIKLVGIKDADREMVEILATKMFEDADDVDGDVDGALPDEMARKNPVHNWEQLNQESRFFFEYYIPKLFANSPPQCTKLTTIIRENLRFYWPESQLRNLPKTGFNFPKLRFPKLFFKHMENLRVLSINNARISALPSSIVCLGKSLKLLKLKNCGAMKSPSQFSYLRSLEKLEVLDLSQTPFEDMSDNFFEGLRSLRLLNLSECHRIFSLPSSVSFLANLERLLLGRCTNLKALPSTLLPLEKLQVLDLSYTDLNEIPEKFFLHMLSLKDLNLSFAPRLAFLPTSMSSLVNLKKLNLQGCIGLATVHPCLTSISSSLEELNLSGCSSLKDSNKFSSSFKDMSNLRVLNLRATSVNSLSLEGCSSLETIDVGSNKNLEVLDLSGTGISTFPSKGDPDLNVQRRLDLLGVKKLRKVNWNNIKWLPQQVNWDQSGDDSASDMHFSLAEWRRVGNESGVFISVENANIFKSLGTDCSLWEDCLSRFLIYIRGYKDRRKQKALSLQNTVSRHMDIYSKFKRHVPIYERCLEIEGGKRFPYAISGVLSHTNFLYLHDEKSVTGLSYIIIKNMDDLRECWFERCAIEVIFDISADDLARFKLLLKSLEKIWISNLAKLTTMCSGSGMVENGSFGNLKLLQLEYCPQLITVFSSGICLENLEVLEIKFCARLREIFSGEKNGVGSLRRLHTLFLLELPALKSIVRNVQLVSLTRVLVKGCRKLRRIPISTTRINSDKSASVTVTGEPEWWKQLEWEDNNVMHRICFNSWKPYKVPRRP